MFGSPFDSSESSGMSATKIRGRSSKAGLMESIVSGDGSSGSEEVPKVQVASGENTAQGVKKEVTEESKNGNPFLDDSNNSNGSNRVGPFHSSDQDFTLDDEQEEEIDVSELVVEELENWNASMKSISNSNRSNRSSGILGLVDASKDIYEYEGNSGNPSMSYNGYNALPNGQASNEQHDDEDQTDSSPLFREESYNMKAKTTTMGKNLSEDNPFNDGLPDDESLEIKTHRPKSNELEGSRYASMQELLDEEHASPFSSEKRKGLYGCIDSTMGGKKTKRRKITVVTVILLFCGGIGAALYVILALKPADSNEMKGTELNVAPAEPSLSPSLVPASNPIGPSFMIPSFVLNGTTSDLGNIPLPPNFSDESNVITEGVFSTAATSVASFNSSLSPSMNPISYNISMTPTVPSLFNESFSPFVEMNLSSSLVPTPTVVFESDGITNGTKDETNASDYENNTINDNETASLAPTPTVTSILSSAPFSANVSVSLMPSLAINDTANISEVNETMTFVPSSSPFNMSASVSMMPSLSLNGTSNRTEQNETSVPTPSPFNMMSSQSLTPTIVINQNQDFSSTAPTQAATLSATRSFLDELSDPWTLYKTLEHEEPSALFGSSLAMSADPILLAAGAKDARNEDDDASGAAFIYSFDQNGTSSLLQIIHGVGANSEFGNSVAISDDGSRLVVGSRSEGNQAGAVRIYSLSGSSYTQLGNTIIGTESSRAGWAVSISGDGSRIAVGSPKGGPEGGGSVITYVYDETRDLWVLYGSEIVGITSGAAVGYSVALSSDGSILAVGNPKAENREGSLNAGKVTTYTIVELQWEVAAEIFGRSSEDVEGTSIALSPDGEYLLTGSKGKNGDDGSMESAGSCQLYQNASGRRWRWRSEIIGQFIDERLGSWVSMARDSSVYACGGVTATLDGFGTYGVVRTWNRRTSVESAIWPRSEDAELSSFGASLAFSPIGLAVGAPDYSGGGEEESLTGVVEIYAID